MIDTPGLIRSTQLTSKLNLAELRLVIPNKPINAITLRVVEGKCVLIGGFAIIELLEVNFVIESQKKYLFILGSSILFHFLHFK